ncbi:alanine--tRNA ligase [Chamaesiphon sp. OTE_20_metabat_361]|uniref:alanine--tRNA ligase n=1 Tax=Chamaesiphon sp. OTE_20_metabat_361 TaxID=2964689 RepID=UPI00286B4671|nr:alanine--tRNA ligase [Chamaesiphon sp. OTE_20_metabat_361]
MSALKLSGAEIRQAFLDFYSQRGHQPLPSGSLVPEDPTVLLTIAGMLPFKPIFLGQRQPDFPRATTSQKCIRTNDIENVGRTARHHTFFEMLGNFSFGDYFKEQAIAWGWEISTQVFRLPPERLVVSVFEDDDEAFAIWRDKIGVNPLRIKRLGADDNFWVSGPTGPCGPCSELYYDFHPELGNDNIDLEDDSRFIEFYNLVFMQYNRDVDGNLTPLANKNIDTGMGLERMAQILQDVPNNYETDLIFPIVQTAADIAGIDYFSSDEKTKTSLKVIGDHIRAIVHMNADGIRASNVGRGYILRRLLRRVVRHGRSIGIDDHFTAKVSETAIALSESAYPNVRSKADSIKAELQREETQFLKTLERGEKLLADLITDVKAKGIAQISGADAFKLYGTYGFPLELTQEIAEEQDLTVDVEGYDRAKEEDIKNTPDPHGEIDLTVQGTLDSFAEHLQATEFVGYKSMNSQAEVVALLIGGAADTEADAGTNVQIILNKSPFYAESGGQIGDRGYLSGDNLLVRIDDVKKESAFFVHFGSIERGNLRVGDTVTAQIDTACRRRAQANHTATHLLQAALKLLVDPEISQAGSLVSFDRLRFDFNSPRALTPAEVQQVEELVNTWITEAHSAEIEVMPIAQAKAKGAVAMFGEKYGDEVRVIDFPGVSMELCGGIHVNNTAEIGAFKIVSEAGVAAGVRRIEAVAGNAILDYLNVRDKVVKELSDRFKAKPEEILDRISTMQTELKANQKQLEMVKGELAIAKSEQLLTQSQTIGEFKIIIAELGDVDASALQTAAERLLNKLGEGAIVLASIPEPDKVSLVAAFSKGVNAKGLQAGKFIGNIAKICGGGGGGRPNLAQAGGRDASKVKEALGVAKAELEAGLG